ncbi:MAG: zf-HC2 domain-containing protein [candidate division Zixibacteria bacterium]|nr:zf-HC2 domain-containing protein [candidate division Zixibacteria bacterium]
MTERCTDIKTGRLIHAYELGLLSDEESEHFEMHLMHCEYCVSLLKTSSLRTGLLRSDSKVRDELRRLSEHSNSKVGWAEELRRYLWPNVPFPFRPAVTLLLVLLLVYPAYLGLTSHKSGEVISLTEIGLVQSRAATIESTSLAAGESAVLTFAYSHYRPGVDVMVLLVDELGQIIYENHAFEGFDAFQTARLFLPSDLLRSGVYRLQVGPAGLVADEIEEYRFRIVR